MKKTLLSILCLFCFYYSVGQLQNALDFDGVDDYVSTSYSGVLGTSNRTFEAMVYVNPNAPNNNLSILDYGTNAVGSRNTFSVNPNGGLTFISGGTNANFSSANNVVASGQWVHVAFVLNNGTGYMFVNGIQQGTGNLSNVNTPSSTSLRIGRRVPGGASNISFSGAIDEVRIWNRALTASELTSNMHNEICGEESNLTAYYQFNHGVDGSNNSIIRTVADIAGSNNGTLNSFTLNGASSNWITSTAGLNPLFDTSVTENSGYLEAQRTGATYQWVDCSTGADITGATNVFYRATATGDYSVSITYNGCELSSNCVTVSTLSNDNFEINDVALVQNPSEQLEFSNYAASEFTLLVNDISGKLMMQTVTDLNDPVKLSIPTGLYLVTLQNGKSKKLFKWLKQ